MGGVARNEDWHRLADEVRARRTELDLTQEDVRAAGGPSTATMRLIEGGLQTSYMPAILRRLEDALHWKRGSVRAVLGGGSPFPLGEEAPAGTLPFPGPLPVPQDGREVRAALHAALAVVNAPLTEVVLAEVRAGIPFTDPFERLIWESPDWPASYEEKAAEIANYRARRAELGAGPSAETG